MQAIQNLISRLRLKALHHSNCYLNELSGLNTKAPVCRIIAGCEQAFQFMWLFINLI